MPPQAVMKQQSNPAAEKVLQVFEGVVAEIRDDAAVVLLWATDNASVKLKRIFTLSYLKRHSITSRGQILRAEFVEDKEGDIKLKMRLIGNERGPIKQKLIDIDYDQFADFNE